MARTNEELLEMLSHYDLKEIAKSFSEPANNPDYKKSEWYGIMNFFDTMKVRSYSIKDMEDKTFHSDFTD